MTAYGLGVRLRTTRARWAGRARTAASFRAADWGVLAEATLVLTYLQLAVHLGSSTRFVNRATLAGATGAPTMADRDARRLSRLVGAAANYHVLRPRCLVRSLALARLLARRGVATELRLGVATGEQGLSAHAWVELNGRVINDEATVADRFAPLHQEFSSQRQGL